MGALELIVLSESALGVWNIRDIVTASPRVTQVGRKRSVPSLGITATTQKTPSFMREAGGNRRHCGRSAAYRYGVSLKPHPRLLPEKDLLHLATMARNLGFKAPICPHPSWIEPLNAAFSPTSSRWHTPRCVRCSPRA